MSAESETKRIIAELEHQNHVLQGELNRIQIEALTARMAELQKQIAAIGNQKP